MVHVAFVRSPHAHARIAGIDAAEALQVPGVLRVFTGKDLEAHCEPWVAVLAHLKGMKSAPQRPLPTRAGHLGRRGGGGRGGRDARHRRGCRRQGPRRLRAVAGGGGYGDGARSRHPRHSSRAGRQSLLPAGERERQRRAGVRRRPQGRGGHLPHRPPHRADAGAALDPGRLQPRLGQAHRPPRHAGAAHDAGRVRPAPPPARGRRARDLRRRGRQLRHQGARLPRRDGRGGDRQDHGPPGEVHRRPAGELLQRHPRPRPPHRGPHGRGRGRAHHGHRYRRPHGHRTLLGLSAHQRGGGQPGGEPGRRPLRLRQLPRQDHGGAAEQDAHLPVPRGGPPHRHRRHRGPRGPRGGGRGPRSGRVPAPQPDGRRQLPAHLAGRHEVRGPVAHRLARQAAGHDRLPGAARRAGAAARRGHLPRHRHRQPSSS